MATDEMVEQGKKEKKRAEKLVDEKIEEEALSLAHALEEEEVPSAVHILKEHKHLVLHEEELKTLLDPVNIAPVQHLGEWKPGQVGVEEIPKIKDKKKI